MPSNADPIADKDRRRDAVNAVRLMYLDHESAAAASRTFKLYPCDLAAARRLLEDWPPYVEAAATESERVAYLLEQGWRKRKRSDGGNDA
jgi:hypothetical protein